MFASSALAADVGSAGYDWNGFYAGVNGGFIMNNVAVENAVDIDGRYGSYDGGLLNFSDDLNAWGGLVGVQAGFNWMASDNVLIGVEGDYGFSGAESTNNYHNTSDDQYGDVSAELTSFSTARLRAGVLVDNALLYVTGGLAMGNVNFNANDYYNDGADESTQLVDDSSWKVGFTVGAGAELALSDNMTMKVEALYYDLGSDEWETSASYDEDSGYAEMKNDVTGIVARAGLNFNF